MSNLVRQMWCHGCCAAVEAVVKEASSVGAGALAGALIGSLHEGTRRRPSAGAMLLKTGVFALVGHLAESVLVPTAQQVACPNCNCTHLSELAS